MPGKHEDLSSISRTQVLRSHVWWYMFVIPVLERQRQVNPGFYLPVIHLPSLPGKLQTSERWTGINTMAQHVNTTVINPDDMSLLP